MCSGAYRLRLGSPHIISRTRLFLVRGGPGQARKSSRCCNSQVHSRIHKLSFTGAWVCRCHRRLPKPAVPPDAAVPVPGGAIVSPSLQPLIGRHDPGWLGSGSSAILTCCATLVVCILAIRSHLSRTRRQLIGLHSRFACGSKPWISATASMVRASTEEHRSPKACGAQHGTNRSW